MLEERSPLLKAAEHEEAELEAAIREQEQRIFELGKNASVLAEVFMSKSDLESKIAAVTAKADKLFIDAVIDASDEKAKKEQAKLQALLEQRDAACKEFSTYEEELIFALTELSSIHMDAAHQAALREELVLEERAKDNEAHIADLRTAIDLLEERLEVLSQEQKSYEEKLSTLERPDVEPDYSMTLSQVLSLEERRQKLYRAQALAERGENEMTEMLERLRETEAEQRKISELMHDSVATRDSIFKLAADERVSIVTRNDYLEKLTDVNVRLGELYARSSICREFYASLKRRRNEVAVFNRRLFDDLGIKDADALHDEIEKTTEEMRALNSRAAESYKLEGSYLVISDRLKVLKTETAAITDSIGKLKIGLEAAEKALEESTSALEKDKSDFFDGADVAKVAEQVTSAAPHEDELLVQIRDASKKVLEATHHIEEASPPATMIPSLDTSKSVMYNGMNLHYGALCVELAIEADAEKFEEFKKIEDELIAAQAKLKELSFSLKAKKNEIAHIIDSLSHDDRHAEPVIIQPEYANLDDEEPEIIETVSAAPKPLPITEEKIEEPIVEAKVEEPIVEEVAAEPAHEDVKTEEPIVEEVKAEEPVVEEKSKKKDKKKKKEEAKPAIREVRVEASDIEEPATQAEAPVEEEKIVDAVLIEEPVVEEVKSEEPVIEEVKEEEPVAAEEPVAVEEPVVEEVKAEEPVIEEKIEEVAAAVEEPVVEEKVEEPVAVEEAPAATEAVEPTVVAEVEVRETAKEPTASDPEAENAEAVAEAAAAVIVEEKDVHPILEHAAAILEDNKAEEEAVIEEKPTEEIKSREELEAELAEAEEPFRHITDTSPRHEEKEKTQAVLAQLAEYEAFFEECDGVLKQLESIIEIADSEEDRESAQAEYAELREVFDAKLQEFEEFLHEHERILEKAQENRDLDE